MIFIFLCIVVLMIMFYLMIRSVDELILLLKEERSAMAEQFRIMTRNMENLAMTQREARDILRTMLGLEDPRQAAPSREQEYAAQQTRLESQEKNKANNDANRNITSFILAE